MPLHTHALMSSPALALVGIGAEERKTTSLAPVHRDIFTYRTRAVVRLLVWRWRGCRDCREGGNSMGARRHPSSCGPYGLGLARRLEICLATGERLWRVWVWCMEEGSVMA